MILNLFFCIIQIYSQTETLCPSQCSLKCSPFQLDCNDCLRKYYQTFDQTNNICTCLPGFRTFQSIPDYCCPNTCKSCSTHGCSLCWKNAKLEFNQTTQASTCRCQQNYFLNDDNNCVCSSIINSQQYYWSHLTLTCNICPQNCSCSQSGCYFCDDSTNRTVVKYQQHFSCHCNPGFSMVNGTCICPKQCICSEKGVINCLSNSTRGSILDKWICINGYQDVDGECVCSQPFEMYEGVCSCMSVSQPTKYYLSWIGCERCLRYCSCNSEEGCYQCDSDRPQYISQYGQCRCGTNFTLVDRECLCVYPNYYQSMDPPICVCMNQLNNSKYYYSHYYQKCYECPKGCICNSSGCVQCEAQTQRFPYQHYSQQQYSCQCNQNYQVQTVEGNCACAPLHVYNALYQYCQCDSSLAIFDYENALPLCNYCPVWDCSCNDFGCYSCYNSTFRIPLLNVYGRYSCFCSEGYVSNPETNNCQCLANYTFINFTQKCICQPPFQIINRTCMCGSQKQQNSQKYYWDPQQKKCYYCPENCICNKNGCVFCQQSTNRIVVKDPLSSLYICKCTQKYFINGNFCSICHNSSYEYTGICVNCSTCLSCDKRGCLQCPQQMMLIDFQCVCAQPFINLAGKCFCPIGSFVISYWCEPCPKWCSICLGVEPQLCLSCPINNHRKNIPARRCECEDNYIEAYPQQQFCCHKSCQTCNISSCLTCPQYSYRQVVNSVCGCVYPFIQIDRGACICDYSYYLFDGKCLKCPQSCKTCHYTPNMTFVQCTSCHQNMNRNTKDVVNCTCLQGFYHTSPIQSSFCVLKYCSSEVAQCTNCLDGRVIRSNKCVCPKGMFQNILLECQKCQIAGCLQCQHYLFCISCDIQNSYLLSNRRCYFINKSEVVMISYVGANQLLIQFSLPFQVQSISMPQIKIAKVQYPQQSHYYDHIIILTSMVQLDNKNIVTCRCQNIQQTIQDVMLFFQISYLNKTRVQNTYQHNIYQQIILSSSQMRNFTPTKQNAGIFISTIIFFIAALVLYILGYKHNQLVFYLQTLCFIGFYMDRDNMDIVQFLYNLRYSFINFDTNIMARIIPNNYIEKCHGNYFILSTDCNIVRNLGLTLVFAFVTQLLLIVSKVINFFTTKYSQLSKYIRYKKVIYRFLEFFHKATKYPLIFFSLQTLLNTSGQTLLETKFKKDCIILSGFILAYYSCYMVLQIFLHILTKLYKIQNSFEFICDILSSLTIILSKGNKGLIAIMFIFFAKGVLYSHFRRSYMNQKRSFILMIGCGFCILVILLVILQVRKQAILGIHVVSCIVVLIVGFLLTYWFHLMGKYDKIKVVLTFESHPDVLVTEIGTQQ